jgi:hypothetical protein
MQGASSIGFKGHAPRYDDRSCASSRSSALAAQPAQLGLPRKRRDGVANARLRTNPRRTMVTAGGHGLPPVSTFEAAPIALAFRR